MICKSTFILVLLLSSAFFCAAQKIDNTAFYRDVASGRSLRLHYENDFFSRSDIYYTQGINLEYYSPGLGKYFGVILLRLPHAKLNYGVAVEHLGFTPTSITSPVVLYGDRPFAACLIGKVFSVSTDSIRKIQMSSTLSMGILGPGAGGKQFQSAIHRWINDRQPMGWEYQIQNDLILNYSAGIVKSLVNLPWLSVSAKMSADVGTLTTKGNGGFIVMTGFFDNRWNTAVRKKFQLYLYDEPVGSLIGYDASLQGGVFNHASRYTLPASAITRTVFQNNAGIIVVIGNVQLEYFQSMLTKEFNSGRLHHWGGVRVGVKL